jgi:catechol 2,3-dioxygenase-like lactoylglutathione lyase family enzyme
MKLTGIHHVSIVVSDMERAVAWYSEKLGIHLIPSDEPDAISPRHFAIHVADVQAARETLRERGVEVREAVPIAGADRFFISDPAGNNLELIQWFRRWDDWSEEELGVPDNAGRKMLTELPRLEPSDGPQ